MPQVNHDWRLMHVGDIMQVDNRNETVLVPIYGVMVPFHILTVKNATNNQACWISLHLLIFSEP